MEGEVRFSDEILNANLEEPPVEYDDEVYEHRGPDSQRGMPLEFCQETEWSEAGKIKWRDVDNVEDARATVGVAFDASWEQAKAEFEFLRQKMQEHCGNRRPKLPQIFNLLLGEESAVYQVFKENKIFTDHVTFMEFLSTHFLSCTYQVSAKQLYDKHSRIRRDGTLSKKEYIATWRRIGAACLPPPADRNKSVNPTGMVPFWMKFEAAFNTYSRTLFLEGFDGDIHITIDDDKCHFSGTKYTAGLKVVRHVKDNRNGHIVHTMVNSHSQMPVQIAWERDQNDSAVVCTERCFSNSITPMAAPGTPGDMRNVFTAKDRGYWSKDLLHDFFMKGGAKITAGTARRQACIPMTFAQKIEGNDTRTDVPLAGPKTLYTMMAVSHGRELYCQAYRNGTGGVILGLTTEHGRTPQWDLVLANPSDLHWCDSPRPQTEEEKVKRCFAILPSVAVEDDGAAALHSDDSFHEMVGHLPVRALTTVQGTPEWFYLRKHSFTSSTTDKVISCIDGTKDWIEHQDEWTTIKSLVAAVVQHAKSSSPEKDGADEPPTLELPDRAINADREEEKKDDSDDEAVNEVAADPEETDEGLTLDGLLSSQPMIEMAKNQSKDGELDIDSVRLILTKLGHNLSKAKDEAKAKLADIKTFDAWLDVAPQLKPHYFKKASDLIAVAKSIKLDVSAHGNKVAPLRKALNDYLLSNEEVQVTAPAAKKISKAKQRSMDTKALPSKQRATFDVIQASNLEPLQGAAKKYTRRGHQLECHIMTSCIKEICRDDVDSPMVVVKACSAPLVEKLGHRFARDSIDFVAMATSDDGMSDEFLIGVEVKARVASRRDQQETRHLESIRQLLGQDRTPRDRRVKYFQVAADSEDFPKLVADTHEAVQVLHHANVCDFECVLLLVGNNNGNVLYGIFVQTSQALRESYGKVLLDVYSNTIEWIYNPSKPKPTDDLKPALALVRVNEAPIDDHSFRMDIALWRDVNDNLSFPIPRLARIIPLTFAFWNTIKGGSDATTNLLWHCNYSIPSDENQSIAVARMLSLVAVHFHRLVQLSTAKEDISTYKTLRSFRDAATQRYSFKRSLNLLVDYMSSLVSPEELVVPSLPRAVSPTPTRVSRSQAGFDRVSIPLIETNKTPMRNVAQRLDQMEQKAISGRLDARSSVALMRTKECTGYGVWCEGTDGKSAGKNSRGTCSHCKSQTHYYCLGCKRWLCRSPSDNVAKLPEWKATVIINPNSDKPIHCENSCFFMMHRAAQEAAIKEFYIKATAMM